MRYDKYTVSCELAVYDVDHEHVTVNLDFQCPLIQKLEGDMYPPQLRLEKFNNTQCLDSQLDLQKMVANQLGCDLCLIMKTSINIDLISQVIGQIAKFTCSTYVQTEFGRKSQVIAVKNSSS